MDLSNLKPAKGATKRKKRIARGQGSGYGGTSTRGHKGAKSRSGYKQKRGFEGGQMPLQRRIPKRGFNSPNKTEYVVFNLAKIQEIADKHKIEKFDIETLRSLRMIQKFDKVKVLAHGELKSKMNIEVHKVSEAAKAAIESAGGSINLI